MNPQKISLISVIVNLGLAILKLLIGLFTHSITLMASALDSGMDIISSFITFLGIKISKKPSDTEHPYGHERYESLAGFVIVIMLFLSAGWILFEATKNIILQETMARFSFLGIIIMACSAVINEVMARLKFYFGNKFSSLALVTDAEHSRVDALSSLAILAGLFLVKFYPLADSILAILVAIYIFNGAYHLGREVVDSLVDTANPQLEEKIKKFLSQDNISFSEIKTRKIGSSSYAEISLLCDPRTKVDEVTLMTKRLEENLLNQISELRQVAILVKSHHLTERVIKPRLGKHLRFQYGLKKIGPEKRGKRIIIPIEDDEFFSEFGAAEYLIMDIDKDNKVVQKLKIKNPYSKPGGPGRGTKFVKSVSADKVITKHIGQNAKKNLEVQKVEIEIVPQDKKLEDLLSSEREKNK